MRSFIIFHLIIFAIIAVGLSIPETPPVAASGDEAQAASSAAPPPVDVCVPMGTAEGQTLYWCENPFGGPDCAWDPSPALGAGVMDCSQ